MALRRWLAPPAVGDAEEAVRAAITYWLLVTAIAVVAVLTVLLPVFEQSVRDTLPIYLSALGGAAGTLVVLQLGYVRTAGALVCILGWGVTLWAGFASAGVKSPQLSMGVLVIMLTGFVWSGRAAIGMAVATSASLLGIEFARDVGIAPEPYIVASRFTTWAALSSVLALAAVFLQIFLRVMHSARQEAAEKSRRLEEEMQRRVEAEASLHQAQKLEALGRLTGGIAHDFNNILTVLLAESDLLVRRAEAGRPLGREELEQIAEIRRSTERASALTRQLLAFSSQQVGVPEPVEPDAVIARFEPMLRRLVREDIELRVDPGAPGVATSIDPARLEQILMNLVLNAVDAMPDGGELALCTERVEPGDGSAAGARAGVVVVVRDSGAGIATDDLPRIFDPFFTTKAPGRGTGLGLSSVHGIVSAAGGRVEVASEPGRGTTFRVHLPAADRATGSVSPAAPARRESGGRATILVCEDEAPVRRVTRRALEVAGHVVHEVDCGESALRWLQEHDEPVDLLISDVVMPGINGRELAARVQAERPGVRVLLVSGYASDVLATGDGGPDFELLEKPFTPETLRRRVEVVLAGAGGVSP